MDNRKFQAAASDSPPAVEASPSTGYPTNGNPATATPATVPGARWFHQVGEELRNVIETAGLTPSDSDLTQLQQAIAAMIASGANNDYKASVRIATTANIASLSGLAAIDGVTPVAGNRILVKDQTTGSQNGIYVAASGAWSRATDADTGTELNGGAIVTVEEGTVNGDTIWELTNNGTVTIGTTALVFTRAVMLPEFIGTNQSLSANGYQRLPGGLIVQWGSFGTIADGATQVITFPIAFPSACVFGTAIRGEAGGADPDSFSINARTATNMTVQFQDSGASSSFANIYFAIGY